MSRQRLMVMAAAIAALGIVGSVMADSASGAAGAVLKMKSGICKFTLVQSDGVRPAAEAELKLTDVKNAERTITAKANALGVCSTEIGEARYIVAVNGRKLGLLETSATGNVSEYRIILPGASAIVAGEEPSPTTDNERRTGSFVLAGLGGAAVGVAVFVVGDHQNWWDGDGDDEADDNQPPADDIAQPTIVTKTVVVTVPQKPSSP